MGTKDPDAAALMMKIACSKEQRYSAGPATSNTHSMCSVKSDTIQLR